MGFGFGLGLGVGVGVGVGLGIGSGIGFGFDQLRARRVVESGVAPGGHRGEREADRLEQEGHQRGPRAQLVAEGARGALEGATERLARVRVRVRVRVRDRVRIKGWD